MKPHHFIIVVDFWSSCFWNLRKFFCIFVREYALYDVLIHEATPPFTHVDRRRYNPQHLDKMKKIYTLIIALAMLVVMADVALAQSTTPVQKTRYVYLWDVTGSIKKGCKVLSESEGLYGRMYGYMRDDILKKADGTEIVVIPFNDDVVDAYNFYIDRGRVRTRGKVQFDELAAKGIELVESHNARCKASIAAKDKSQGGFTDIAKSLDRVREEYITNECNTIFILLTDGGQEYVDGIVKTKGDEARCYLQQAIANFDKKMCNAKTFNMLFYVMTVNDDYSPRKKEMTIAKTEFISALESSAKLVFCPLVASIPTTNSKISCRDEQFPIKVSAAEGVSLPKDMNLKVSFGASESQTIAVRNGKANVACKNRFKLAGGDDCSVPITLEAQLKQSYVKDGSSYYIYWLDTKTLTLNVTNDFTPRLTLQIK